MATAQFAIDVWEGQDDHFVRIVNQRTAQQIEPVFHHAVRDQIDWIIGHGGDLAGYLRYYSRTTRLSVDQIVQIFHDDIDELNALREEVKKEQEELVITVDGGELVVDEGELYEDVEIW